MDAAIRRGFLGFLIVTGVVLGGRLWAEAAEARQPSAPLRVGLTTAPSVAEWKGDHPVGAIVDVWNELARRLDLETDYVRIDSFVGLIAAARDGSVDVALGPLAITEERERVLDLSHPVFHSGLRIAVRQRGESSFMTAAKTLFSWSLLQLLAIILLLVLLSGHLLWWFEHGHNPKSFPPEYPRGVLEAIWWITSTIITGGCDDKHVDGPLGRILALVWMVGGIGLIAAVTSVLTATMTAEQVRGMINSPRDLAGRLVGVLQSGVTVSSVKQRGGIPQEFPTVVEAVEALNLGLVEAVVHETDTLSRLVNTIGQGRLKVVGPIFDPLDYGLALPSGSPLRESLNTEILRMREEGSVDRIRERWFGKHE